MSEHTVKNLPDLISKIIENSKKVKGPIWYRGHADETWPLVPSIFRKDVNPTGMSELQYMKKFKQDAMLLTDPKPTKPYEWLFVMRHYGIPTRLLDWTENPLVAAFFVVDEKLKTPADGTIWALLPQKLNEKISTDSLPSFDEDVSIMENYQPKTDEGEPKNTGQTVAFIAPRNSQRMQAQLSVCTISGDVGDDKEKITKDHIWKYKIPQDIKKNIKDELAAIGINIFQVFPELERIGEKNEN